MFATEGFESYNAVIRTRSIHSNRLAPSRDIAWAFSYMHAIRHLVSGGWFSRDANPYVPGTIPAIWDRAGEAVRNLVKDPIYSKLMGIQSVLAYTAPIQGMLQQLELMLCQPLILHTV